MLKKYFKDLKIEKICLLIILAFIFTTMYYTDNQNVFTYIQDNMNRIISGKWYYIFNGWSTIPYGILLQLLCAIWSLPIFILSKIGILSYTSIIARIWYKFFICIFLILNINQLDKLAEKSNVLSEKKEWLKIFFLSSLLVALPVIHIAQFDIVYLFFILWGINYSTFPA